MQINRFITLLSALIGGLVSLLSLFGWAAAIPELNQFDLKSDAMSALSALLGVILSIGLLLMLSGHLMAARLISSALVLGTLLLLFEFIGWLPFTLVRPAPFGATSLEEISDGLALGTVLAFLMLSISLFIQSHARILAIHNSISLVCALLASSISLLALFGHLASIEFAFWWPGSPQMARNTAGVIFFLSVGFLALTWHRFSLFFKKSTDIVFGIQAASGSILFVTVLLCGSLSLIPLYETLLDKVYDETKRSIETKTAQLSQFFASIQLMADTLGQSNALLEQQSEPSSHDSPQTVVPVVLDQMSPGIDQLLFTSETRSAVGPEFTTDQYDSNMRARNALSRLEPQLVVRHSGSEIGELLVSAAVVTTTLERQGTITATINLEYLRDLLVANVPASAAEGTFYLLSNLRAPDTSLLKIAVSEPKSTFIVVEKAPYELLRALSPDKMQEQSPTQAILSRDMVSFVSPLKGARAYLGFVSRVSPFRNLFKEKLLSILGGIMLVLISGTGFIYFLMRKLGRQMLSLEGQVQESLDNVAKELTLRRQVQHQMEKSLEEKEVLLKEIHHRVKNNLQVISSILSLQLRRSERPEVASGLRDSADRIQSIALLHETLYRSSNLVSIALSEYLEELVTYLGQSYNMSGRLNSSIEANQVVLELDRLIPLGLILTELITNSLKYAFRQDSGFSGQPCITISCQVDSAKRLVLHYSDNGVGLPKDFSLKEPRTLGLRLITTLIKQLRGEIEFRSDKGTKFIIYFPYHGEITEVAYEESASVSC